MECRLFCFKFVYMESTFINKVAESGIVTLNLEDFFPEGEVMVFDIKDYLFMELILKEKDFREALRQLNLDPFTGKNIAITCSADAIIPMWAYMLVASALQPIASDIFVGTKDEVTNKILIKNIQKLNATNFTDQRIVIKGCGEMPVSEEAYMEITKKLRPVAKSIMYGEPCSTVPVFKKPVVRT